MITLSLHSWVCLDGVWGDVLVVNDGVSEIRGNWYWFGSFVIDGDMNYSSFSEFFVVCLAFGDVFGGDTTITYCLDL